MTRPRQTRVRLPDTVVIDRPDLKQVITPSLRLGGLNEVAFANFDPAQADEQIDQALDRFRRADVRYRWTVAPDCGPIDLADRLRARGLRSTKVHAVARELTGFAATNRSLDVEAVTLDTVDEFSLVMAEGWGAEVEPLKRFHRAALESGAFRLYLSRLPDGTPAATSASILFPDSGSVYLLGAVVLEKHRRLGHYRASIERRLEDAVRHGCRLAFSHALADSSAPRLHRAGFRDVYVFDSFAP
jgi:hypothetical protein